MRKIWEKLRRHPVHPLAAHFPIVLWTGSSLLDAYSWIFSPDLLYWRVSRAFLLAGVLSSLPAMFLGLLDFMRRKDCFSANALKTLGLHVTCAGIAFMLYTIALIFHGTEFTKSNIQLLASFFQAGGWLCLLVAGFSGADLIYSHGVWVSKEKQRH